MFLLTGCHGSGESHDDHDHEHEEAAEHNEEHHHEGALTISDEQAKQFGIETETLSPGPFSDVIRVSGRIEPASSDTYTVTARQSGIFTLSSGITEGMRVGQGTNIGTISPHGVQGGDVNLAAKATLEAAKKELDRLTPLFKDGLVTAAVYNDAERAYKEALALTASAPTGGPSSESSPIAGTLTTLYVGSGQYVEVGAPIALISKNTSMTLRADVPARHALYLPSIVSANFRPENSDKVFSIDELGGRKTSGANTVAGTDGYIPLYFTFTGDARTLAGTFAEVYLIGRQREGILTVPKTALIEMQGNKYAYVVEHGHAYEKRLVTTGATDGKRVEITSGLEKGEQVVSKGASVVRMAETSAVAPPSHTHNH